MRPAAEGLDWDTDGRDWPNRDASRQIDAGGLTWHVQRMGRGPALLMIHGTGASTHSWRDLAPLLARQFDVLAFDLPGHGFTGSPSPALLTLPGMARGIGQLLRVLDFRPEAIVGHSAGAAIAVRMCLDGLVKPKLIVSLNGALLPFPGLGRHLLPSLAKLLYTNTVVPRLMAWRAQDAGSVSRLLRSTGSHIDDRGIALYHRLFSNTSHVTATLSMMASWDLIPLETELAELKPHLVLAVGALDRAIPPEEGLRPAKLVPHSTSHFLRNLGHLAHEERPEEIARLIVTDCAASGLHVHQPLGESPREDGAP